MSTLVHRPDVAARETLDARATLDPCSPIEARASRVAPVLPLTPAPRIAPRLRRAPALLTPALLCAVACAPQGAGDASAAADTTAVATDTTVLVDELPGEAVDFGPGAGEVVAVIGVAHDDVLQLRSGPGVAFAAIGSIAPTHAGLVAQGRARMIPGAIWILVDHTGAIGWVNARYVAHLGATYDATADRVQAVGGRPVRTTMTELGRLVTQSMRSTDGDAAPQVVEVVAARVGDLGEVTFDLVGLGDDSVRGYRVHTFGEPVAGGFALRNVEVTLICARGVGEGGLCL